MLTLTGGKIWVSVVCVQCRWYCFEFWRIIRSKDTLLTCKKLIVFFLKKKSNWIKATMPYLQVGRNRLVDGYYICPRQEVNRPPRSWEILKQSQLYDYHLHEAECKKLPINRDVNRHNLCSCMNEGNAYTSDCREQSEYILREHHSQKPLYIVCCDLVYSESC